MLALRFLKVNCLVRVYRHRRHLLRTQLCRLNNINTRLVIMPVVTTRIMLLLINTPSFNINMRSTSTMSRSNSNINSTTSSINNRLLPLNNTINICMLPRLLSIMLNLSRQVTFRRIPVPRQEL